MKRINEAMSSFHSSPDFSRRYEQMKREVLEDRDVARFIDERQLTGQDVNRAMGKLYEYTTQSHSCRKCPSLDGCINVMKGFEPELAMRHRVVELDYKRCPRKVREDEMSELRRHVKSLYMPPDVLKATFEQIDIDSDSRIEAVALARDFVDDYRPGEMTKGLYIHGKFGVGKSFLFGAIANELAEKHVASMVVYFPEFVREMKQSISDQSTEQKVAAVKNAPVLMIDDIGAETMSSWIRDDILGTILQHRMMERLPVLFTSNFNYKELEHHLTHSQRGESELLKAARVMERIKFLTTPVEMAGINRRH